MRRARAPGPQRLSNRHDHSTGMKRRAQGARRIIHSIPQARPLLPAMSSPFALTSSRGSLFANKKAVDTSPPEDVVLVASKSQVITAIIPYGTKKSQAIRAFMHANVVSTDDSTKGARFFIYRQVNGWSTIHLESTEAVPKLTGDPITVLKTAWREFTANCADVGNVKIKWEGSNEIMGYDDIDGMEGLFDPLPDSTNANPSTGPAKTDGEMIYELEEKIYTKVTAVEANVDTIARRLAHVVDFSRQDVQRRPFDGPVSSIRLEGRPRRAYW